MTTPERHDCPLDTPDQWGTRRVRVLVPPEWRDQIPRSRMINGRLCGVQPFLFTAGLLVGFDGMLYEYDARYCYETAAEAVHALVTWRGRAACGSISGSTSRRSARRGANRTGAPIGRNGCRTTKPCEIPLDLSRKSG